MIKKLFVLILCICLCSFSPSFADISTTVQTDANSITIRGTTTDHNVMLYLLRPQKTSDDLENAFVSGNPSDTIVHYRQLEVLNGKYEYTIVMSDTDEKGEYLLCIGNESTTVYYAPIEYRLALAMQTASAQNGSEAYETINENKRYFGINLTLYDALSKKSLVGDLTYEQLKGITLDENDEGSLTTVVTKINESILIAALNEGLISNIEDISLTTDSTKLNTILELKSKITANGTSVLLNNLTNQNFSSYDAFVNTLKSQIILQTINYPVEDTSEFLLGILTGYYDVLTLDLSDFNSLTKSKKATAVNKLSASKSTVSNVAKKFNEIVKSLLTTSSGGPISTGKKTSSDSSGMKVMLSDTVKDVVHPVPVSDGFTDMAEYEWAKEAVESLSKKAVIIGYSDVLFMPANNITRAEFTTIVVRALYEVSSEYKQVFDDVNSSHWAFSYIMCAYEKGIINGVDESHFNPDSSITREDMAKILFSIISFSDNETIDNYEVFSDDATISDYAKTAIYTLKAAGIIKGMNDNTFAPKALAARAEAAQLIYNFINSKYSDLTVKSQSVLDNTKDSLVRKHEKDLNLLISLGMIDDSLEFNYSAQIKKGYFAMMAAYIKGMPADRKATGKAFDDVPVTSEYAPSIEFLSELGVLDNENNFSPNDNITLIEAIKILLGITNYSYFAEVSGDYPNGYLTIAAKKKLLTNVESSYNEILQGSDMIPLLANTLMLNVVNYKGSDIFEENTDLTILESWHNVFSEKGIIVANSLTTFYAESDLQENIIQLESNGQYINLNCGKTDIADEIGNYAKVYYRHDSKLDDSVCLYYETDKNDIVTIDIDDLNTISDRSITYYKDADSKKETLSLDEKFAVIYNRTYYPDKLITKEFLENKKGEISAVDNNGDGNYDILKIVAYETYVINSVLSKSGVFFDKYDSTVSVNIDKDIFDEYSLLFADGTKAVIEDLVSGTVVSVSANDERCAKRVIKLIASDHKISGVITEIEGPDENTIIILDNSGKYNVNKKAVQSLPGVGKGVVAYLDAFSNIAYVTNNNSGVFSYGLVIATHQENDISGKVSIKIYGSGLTSEIYPLVKNVVIDGTRCKGYNEAYTKISQVAPVILAGNNLPAGVFPVRYMVGENNEISELDTPTRGIYEEQNSLTYITNDTSVFSSDSCLGYEFPINASTTLINIRGSNLSDKYFFEDDKYLSYTNATTLSKGNTYKYVAYKVDNSSPYVSLLITYSGYGVSHNHELFTINRVFKVYDEKTNENLYCLEGVIVGGMRKVLVSPKYESSFLSLNLGPGDVIRYDVDYKRHLISIDSSLGVVKYNYNNNTVTLNNINGGETTLSNVKSANTSTHLFHGYVKSREEGLIEFVYASGGATKTIDIRPNNIDWDNKSNILHAQISSSTLVTVYDTSENEINRVYVGTYDDIADYIHNGNAYSRVLLRYRSSELREVVVFNDFSLVD